eukprot:705014-Heterocapsa_arctica.AAC.1
MRTPEHSTNQVITACPDHISVLMFIINACFNVAIIFFTSPTDCSATPLACESPTGLASGTVAARCRATARAQALMLGS